MAIELATVVKQSSDQISCRLEDDVALLNLKTTLYFGIDEVGGFIWKMISKPITVAEICEAICEQYDVDEQGCRGDVIAFLHKLDEAGLVETSK
jgi:hypothetical protein